jgi:hypothetical protein
VISDATAVSSQVGGMSARAAGAAASRMTGVRIQAKTEAESGKRRLCM